MLLYLYYVRRFSVVLIADFIACSVQIIIFSLMAKKEAFMLQKKLSSFVIKKLMSRRQQMCWSLDISFIAVAWGHFCRNRFTFETQLRYTYYLHAVTTKQNHVCQVNLSFVCMFLFSVFTMLYCTVAFSICTVLN